MTDENVRKIYIFCGNAAYNKGDRGNLMSQISLLKQPFPNAELVIDSYRPEVDRTWYGVTVIKRGLFLTREQIRHAKEADVIVWGGGALIADNSCRTIIPYWLLVISFLKFVLRKPIMAWAHGVVLTTQLGRILSRIVYRWVDIITVRDAYSLGLVSDLHVPTPLYQTADPAILINPSDARVGRDILAKAGVPPTTKKIIAISPTFWMFYHNRRDIIPFMFAKKLGLRSDRNKENIEKYKQALTELIQKLHEEYEAHIVLLPRYPDKPWDDVAHLRDVAKESRLGSNVTVFTDDSHPPQDYLSMFLSFDLVVSTALHDAIFATALTVPCVQLYYEGKGKSFFEELHAVDRMHSWKILFEDNGIEKVMATVRKTLNTWPTITQETQPYLERIRNAAMKNVEYLQSLVRTQ